MKDKIQKIFDDIGIYTMLSLFAPFLLLTFIVEVIRGKKGDFIARY